MCYMCTFEGGVCKENTVSRKYRCIMSVPSNVWKGIMYIQRLIIIHNPIFLKHPVFQMNGGLACGSEKLEIEREVKRACVDSNRVH
jgi:hypothetical protein